jgi:hypothetical protein
MEMRLTRDSSTRIRLRTRVNLAGKKRRTSSRAGRRTIPRPSIVRQGDRCSRAERIRHRGNPAADREPRGGLKPESESSATPLSTRRPCCSRLPRETGIPCNDDGARRGSRTIRDLAASYTPADHSTRLLRSCRRSVVLISLAECPN